MNSFDFQPGKDFAGALQEKLTGIGERDAPGAAQQQRDAKPLFQLADDARHRWLRQAEFAAGSREAAAVRGANENRQFLEPIAHSYNE